MPKTLVKGITWSCVCSQNLQEQINWSPILAMVYPLPGYPQNRSSHQSCSVWKGVLRKFTKFTGKHLCQSLFFNKVAGLKPATLLKKRLWHRCFSVNFVKFLRTPFLENTSGRPFLTKEPEVAEVKVFAKYFETTKPIDELLSLCFLCI